MTVHDVRRKSPDNEGLPADRPNHRKISLSDLAMINEVMLGTQLFVYNIVTMSTKLLIAFNPHTGFWGLLGMTSKVSVKFLSLVN